MLHHLTTVRASSIEPYMSRLMAPLRLPARVWLFRVRIGWGSYFEVRPESYSAQHRNTHPTAANLSVDQ